MPTVTVCSCIASSSADWVFGVARLISSASTMLAKTGPASNRKTRSPEGVLGDDVGADDVGGHQVGRELDAAELEVERLAERPDQQGLAQPRHALEQRVPSSDHADEDAANDLLLADDELGHLTLDGLDGLLKAFDGLGVGGRRHVALLIAARLGR